MPEHALFTTVSPNTPDTGHREMDFTRIRTYIAVAGSTRNRSACADKLSVSRKPVLLIVEEYHQDCLLARGRQNCRVNQRCGVWNQPEFDRLTCDAMASPANEPDLRLNEVFHKRSSTDNPPLLAS